MTHKEILHDLLHGLDAYISCGCPDPVWNLSVKLTWIVYGDPGVALLEKFHKKHDGSVDARDKIILHTVSGWDDPNTYVGPEELIQKLESL